MHYAKYKCLCSFSFSVAPWRYKMFVLNCHNFNSSICSQTQLSHPSEQCKDRKHQIPTCCCFMVSILCFNCKINTTSVQNLQTSDGECSLSFSQYGEARVPSCNLSLIFHSQGPAWGKGSRCRQLCRPPSLTH